VYFIIEIYQKGYFTQKISWLVQQQYMFKL